MDGSPNRRGVARRAAALIALILVVTASYLIVLARFDLAQTPRERVFAALPETPDKLRLYLDPVSIDPTDDSLQLRLYVTPGEGLLGRAGDTLDRDVTLTTINEGNREQRRFRAEEAIVPATLQLDLDDGSVVAYPFDRYRLNLRLQATDAAANVPIVLETTVWEQLLGYKMRSERVGPQQPGEISLVVDIRRADAQIFFALAAYLSMAVVACCALAISGFVFVGQRKVEAALTCALGPMVFALPALRNALPGAPPLGVRADLAVFLWAELAVVLALALFVFCWARQRP